MEPNTELDESKSRAEQLIGRNVLLFQEMERLLKVLIPRATISISRDCDVRADNVRRHATVEKSTLGNLVNRFIDGILDPNDPELPDDSGEVRIDASIRLKFDAPEERDAMIQRLIKLVDGRNQLVHHLLAQVDVDSPRSWRSIRSELETMEPQIISAIEALRPMVEMTYTIRALVIHPEFRRELAYGPIREQLLEQLRAAARNSPDPDGWTLLRKVIRNDGSALSASFTTVCEGYEVETVSAFLETVDGFEVRHDRKSNGKSKTYYRITRIEGYTDSDSPRWEA